MRPFLVLVALIAVACGTPAATAPPNPAPTPAFPSLQSSPIPTAAPTPLGTTAAITPASSLAFKAGAWPAEWQLWICTARAEMLREDAKKGGTAGEDAATQAIADLRKTTINWDAGADLRQLLGKAAFILLDAAPRGGNAMNDVPPAIEAFETAYSDLKAATGFECP